MSIVSLSLSLLAAQDAIVGILDDAFDCHYPSYGGMVIDVEGMPKGVSLTLFFEEKGWTYLPLGEGEFGLKGFLVRWGEGKINPTPLVFA